MIYALDVCPFRTQKVNADSPESLLHLLLLLWSFTNPLKGSETERVGIFFWSGVSAGFSILAGLILLQSMGWFSKIFGDSDSDRTVSEDYYHGSDGTSPIYTAPSTSGVILLATSRASYCELFRGSSSRLMNLISQEMFWSVSVVCEQHSNQ